MKTSKIICFFTMSFFFFGENFSQNIGINTTGTPANSSAGLDVDFTNKGVLIPRVALTSSTDATTIPSPATSLLIYNTATAGTSPNNVSPGYYYNRGTPASPVWVQVNYSTTSAASSPNMPILLYTRGTAAHSASNATKDAVCTSEYGSNYWTASVQDIALYAKGSSTPFSTDYYFNTTNTGASFYLGTDGTTVSTCGGGCTGTETVIKKVGGPVLMQVVGGSYKIACIRKDAPVIISRSTAAHSASNAIKDAACVNDFGNSYQAASVQDITTYISNGSNAILSTDYYFNTTNTGASFFIEKLPENSNGSLGATVGGTYKMGCIRKSP